MLLAITLGPLASEILVIAAILLVLYIILKSGNIILGLILNSVLGLIAIYVINALFSLGIAYNLITIIVVAVFGLPAVAVVVILKLLGISI
jgi:lipopolysaccharide export LptBFGC system permease protein LptF